MKPFKKSLALLRDLADMQNDSPSERERSVWEAKMREIYAFLEKYETDTVCSACGIEYLEENGNMNISTFNIGICCLCGEQKDVTHIRAYNYLKKIK